MLPVMGWGFGGRYDWFDVGTTVGTDTIAHPHWYINELGQLSVPAVTQLTTGWNFGGGNQSYVPTSDTASTALNIVGGTFPQATTTPKGGMYSNLSVGYASNGGGSSVLTITTTQSITSTSATGVFDMFSSKSTKNFAVVTTVNHDGIVMPFLGNDQEDGVQLALVSISATQFTQIYFDIASGDMPISSSGDYSLSSGGGWVGITPTSDGTNEFNQSGMMVFPSSVTTWWESTTMNSTGYAFKRFLQEASQGDINGTLDAVSCYNFTSQSITTTLTADNIYVNGKVYGTPTGLPAGTFGQVTGSIPNGNYSGHTTTPLAGTHSDNTTTPIPGTNSSLTTIASSIVGGTNPTFNLSSSTTGWVNVLSVNSAYSVVTEWRSLNIYTFVNGYAFPAAASVPWIGFGEGIIIPNNDAQTLFIFPIGAQNGDQIFGTIVTVEVNHAKDSVQWWFKSTKSSDKSANYTSTTTTVSGTGGFSVNTTTWSAYTIPDDGVVYVPHLKFIGYASVGSRVDGISVGYIRRRY